MRFIDPNFHTNAFTVFLFPKASDVDKLIGHLGSTPLSDVGRTNYFSLLATELT